MLVTLNPHSLGEVPLRSVSKLLHPTLSLAQMYFGVLLAKDSYPGRNLWQTGNLLSSP